MRAHSFQQRSARLLRLIAEGERRVAALERERGDSPQQKRARTIAIRSLKRHQEDLRRVRERFAVGQHHEPVEEVADATA